MARITVEDCLEKVDSQYDLVLLAKERTSQLNAGDETLVPKDRDKNTVIALREIGEGKVSIKTLEDSAINKLRKQQEETSELEDLPNATILCVRSRPHVGQIVSPIYEALLQGMNQDYAFCIVSWHGK